MPTALPLTHWVTPKSLELVSTYGNRKVELNNPSGVFLLEHSECDKWPHLSTEAHGRKGRSKLSRELGSNALQKDRPLRSHRKGGEDIWETLRVGTCKETSTCVTSRHWKKCRT